MTWDELSERQQAAQLLRVLADLARADGEVHAREADFLRQAGAHHGLPAAEVERLLRGDGDAESPTLPLAEPERLEVLYYLVALTQTDGTVGDREAAGVARYAHRLGFREELGAQLVGLAREYGRYQVPWAELWSRVRAYLN